VTVLGGQLEILDTFSELCRDRREEWMLLEVRTLRSILTMSGPHPQQRTTQLNVITRLMLRSLLKISRGRFLKSQ
jgi:hypothetical protein